MPRKITAAEAAVLLEYEDDARKKTAAAEASTTRRDDLREKLRPRVPLARDADDRAKGIRDTIVDGIQVRLCPVDGNETFSLAKYRQLGGRITASMKRAMGVSRGYDRWTVKRVDGK